MIPQKYIDLSPRAWKIWLAWTLLNLLQSIFTPIIGDEAYYWWYSQDLDWGYFDHPPAVAVLIWLSSLLFSGGLGIRLMSVLLHATTVLLMWQLVPEQHKKAPHSDWVFFAALCSLPVFHIYGFITTPDVPLLFFFALYLLALEQYRKRNSLMSTLLLGGSAALLLYAKYHGGLLILISFLVQPALLKRGYSYLAGLFALILILPHLYWQYTHEFITFDYHLFQRTSGAFHLSQVFHYLGGTIGMLNPAWIVVLVLALFRRKKETDSASSSSHSRLFWGILLFFFLYSFRSRIEAHWVAAASIPLILVLHQLVMEGAFRRKQFYVPGLISLGLFILLRVLVILPLPIKSEFHAERKSYFLALSEAAGEVPVVFLNSYKRAAKYQLYTGKPAFSDNNAVYRKNQYDLGQYSEDFHNQNVWLIGSWEWPAPMFDTLTLKTGEQRLYARIDSFPVITQLRASFPKLPNSLFPQDTIRLSLRLENGHSYPLHFGSVSMPFRFQLYLRSGKNRYFIPATAEVGTMEAGGSQEIELKTSLQGVPAGEYSLYVTLKPGELYPRTISRKQKVSVGSGHVLNPQSP